MMLSRSSKASGGPCSAGVEAHIRVRGSPRAGCGVGGTDASCAPAPQHAAVVALDEARVDLLLRSAHQLYKDEQYLAALETCQRVRS
jgi:hypothetical protein